MKRGKVMKRQHLMTITESQYGAGCGVITFADMVLAIENDDVVTVSDKGGRLCMEFTGPGADTAPFAVVYGTLSMDGWSVKAEVGPGYALTQETLDAYEHVALRRIARNHSVRGNITRHNSACADHCPIANRYAGQDHCPTGDPNVIADHDWSARSRVSIP